MIDESQFESNNETANRAEEYLQNVRKLNDSPTQEPTLESLAQQNDKPFTKEDGIQTAITADNLLRLRSSLSNPVKETFTKREETQMRQRKRNKPNTT